jgi:hypothetical protein
MRCTLLKWLVSCARLEAELDRWQRDLCNDGPYRCPWLCEDCICLEEITEAR